MEYFTVRSLQDMEQPSSPIDKFEFIYYEPLRLQRLYLYNFFAVLNLIV